MREHTLLLRAVLFALVSALGYAQAPVPFINLPLVPDATAPGGGAFTLTVNGTGFVSNSVVNWNGNALATQFVSGSQLTATVPAADIATASTAWVTVVSPAPGGGTSNTAFFTVVTSVGAKVLGFAQVSPPTYDSFMAIKAGDFNGDGNLDLAVASYNSDAVVIFLEDGKGNFTLASSPSSTIWDPTELAVGDFNGDGHLDLAVANSVSVAILLGDGTGNFNLAPTPPGGVGGALAVGDFNGDGKLDLVAGSAVLLGDGTGNFNLGSYLPTSGSLAVGDFNGDGKLVLAVVNYYDSVSTFLGDGTGNFTLASSTELNWPFSIAAGDFNGDGKLDLAVVSKGYEYGSQSNAYILLGDGAGNFTLSSSPQTGHTSNSVELADLNGDGNLDMAVVNFADGSVSILLGKGNAHFTLATPPGVGFDPEAIAIGDFNNDGKLDLAVPGYDSGLHILLQGLPAVALYPGGLGFGTQVIGTASNPQTLTLFNTGGGVLKLTSIVTSANFGQSNNCGSKLAPQASCTITVFFRPHQVGALNGTITVTDNASYSPQTAPLYGVGTAMTLEPSGLNFGDQAVGTDSQPQTVTLTNYGKLPVHISHVGLTGTNPGAFFQTNTCGKSVPAQASCTISVTFAPEYRGSKSATLSVTDDGGASPQTVMLTGSGTP